MGKFCGECGEKLRRNASYCHRCGAGVKVDEVSGKKRLFAAMILDSSGSMLSMAKEAVDGFNENAETIRKACAGTDLDAKVCLVTFSTFVNGPTFWCTDVDQLRPMKLSEYKPEGMTALYDAVGSTVERLQKEPFADSPDTSFLLMIVTDGFENNSKDFDRKKIGELMQSIAKTGRWTVTYAGTADNLEEIKDTYGISAGNVFRFDDTPDGYAHSTRVRAAGLSAYTSSVAGGQASVDDFYHQGSSRVEVDYATDEGGDEDQSAPVS